MNKVIAQIIKEMNHLTSFTEDERDTYDLLVQYFYYIGPVVEQPIFISKTDKETINSLTPQH